MSSTKKSHFQTTVVAPWDACTKGYTAEMQWPELAYCQGQIYENYFDGMDLPDAVEILVNCLTTLAGQ